MTRELTSTEKRGIDLLVVGAVLFLVYFSFVAFLQFDMFIHCTGYCEGGNSTLVGINTENLDQPCVCRQLNTSFLGYWKVKNGS